MYMNVFYEKISVRFSGYVPFRSCAGRCIRIRIRRRVHYSLYAFGPSEQKIIINK